MINIKLFWESLNVMWKGMLGIFIVTAVVILVIMLLNAVTKKKAGKPEDSN